ncbi:hypothetical protein NEFER03_0817 [Nematocida sp. LUAm3]|nr:hypothetical protein NEFER03_0817 [Nematocida sp. LUAm3]KAI5174835.1 hypothetical protein NEFER02_0935 [Nematocida sp. LUAm2]KAI5177567.1 hypothetical protein NEFER01_0817 [Nematocida sp. LUAm1]
MNRIFLVEEEEAYQDALGYLMAVVHVEGYGVLQESKVSRLKLGVKLLSLQEIKEFLSFKKYRVETKDELHSSLQEAFPKISADALILHYTAIENDPQRSITAEERDAWSAIKRYIAK